MFQRQLLLKRTGRYGEKTLIKLSEGLNHKLRQKACFHFIGNALSVLLPSEDKTTTKAINFNPLLLNSN